MSAYPIVAAWQLRASKVKMAMAVVGKNRHYGWGHIAGRHWLTTAHAARLSEEVAVDVLRDVAAIGPRVMRAVAEQLPAGFPAHVAEPILAGVTSTLARIGEQT